MNQKRVLRTSMLVVLLVFAGSPSDASTSICSGFAPTATVCATGTHARTAGLSQDVGADFDYVGTVETSLTWSSGTRIFRCTYTASAPSRTCLSFGDFPPINASFTHRCRSIVPGTAVTVAPGVTLAGVEGGVGQWQCSVTY